MADPDVQLRRDLLAPYERPYRHGLPQAWRLGRVGRALVAGGASLAVGGALWALTGASGWMTAGASAAAASVAITAWVSAVAARHIRRLTRRWDRASELGSVHAKRAHRGERDPEAVHDEYAVTVEDSGHLYVWRMRPLAAGQDADPSEVLVPGRPQHSAVVAQELRFDPLDAARAAEQLVAAQSVAAELEQQASQRAATQLAAARDAHALEAETRSTADALRHLTGQGDRDA